MEKIHYGNCIDCLYYHNGHCDEYDGAMIDQKEEGGPCFTPRRDYNRALDAFIEEVYDGYTNEEKSDVKKTLIEYAKRRLAYKTAKNK